MLRWMGLQLDLGGPSKNLQVHFLQVHFFPQVGVLLMIVYCFVGIEDTF